MGYDGEGAGLGKMFCWMRTLKVTYRYTTLPVTRAYAPWALGSECVRVLESILVLLARNA